MFILCDRCCKRMDRNIHPCHTGCWSLILIWDTYFNIFKQKTIYIKSKTDYIQGMIVYYCSFETKAIMKLLCKPNLISYVFSLSLSTKTTMILDMRVCISVTFGQRTQVLLIQWTLQ